MKNNTPNCSILKDYTFSKKLQLLSEHNPPPPDTLLCRARATAGANALVLIAIFDFHNVTPPPTSKIVPLPSVRGACVSLAILKMVVVGSEQELIIIIIIIVDICYAPVSARRRSWCRSLLLLPCHCQEIIRAISLLIRLFAANGQLLAQTYEHLDCDIPLNKYLMRVGQRSKRGKVICPGSQHVGRSGAWTHSLRESCAVPLDHTCPLGLLYWVTPGYSWISLMIDKVLSWGLLKGHWTTSASPPNFFQKNWDFCTIKSVYLCSDCMLYLTCNFSLTIRRYVDSSCSGHFFKVYFLKWPPLLWLLNLAPSTIILIWKASLKLLLCSSLNRYKN